MTRSLVLIYSLLSRRRLSESRRTLFLIPTSLALVTSLAIIFYISSTSNIFTNQHPPLLLKHTISSSLNFPPTNSLLTAPLTNISSNLVNLQESPHLSTTQLNFDSTGTFHFSFCYFFLYDIVLHICDVYKIFICSKFEFLKHGMQNVPHMNVLKW